MLENYKDIVIQYSKLSYDRFLVGAAGGNVSIRIEDKVLITAGGVSLRDITRENIIVLDIDGNIIEMQEGLKPSKETGMHLCIYKERPEITCIIHVHPVHVTAFSVKNRPIPMLTASSKLKLIDTPVVAYAEPGSKELASMVGMCVKELSEKIKVILLEAHGLISFGKDMDDCFNNAELAEETAKIAFVVNGI